MTHDEYVNKEKPKQNQLSCKRAVYGLLLVKFIDEIKS